MAGQEPGAADGSGREPGRHGQEASRVWGASAGDILTPNHWAEAGLAGPSHFFLFSFWFNLYWPQIILNERSLQKI
jgi:hypothetical protein